MLCTCRTKLSGVHLRAGGGLFWKSESPRPSRKRRRPFRKSRRVYNVNARCANNIRADLDNSDRPGPDPASVTGDCVELHPAVPSNMARNQFAVPSKMPTRQHKLTWPWHLKRHLKIPKRVIQRALGTILCALALSAAAFRPLARPAMPARPACAEAPSGAPTTKAIKAHSTQHYNPRPLRLPTVSWTSGELWPMLGCCTQ